MTENEAKKYMLIEKECINRDCNRDCANCDIVQDVEDLNNAYDVAINALEKQIPKKVITPPCNTCEKELCDCECKHFAVTYRDDYRCPTCDSNGVYISEYELIFDYCPNCGQKLDWSDEE